MHDFSPEPQSRFNPSTIEWRLGTMGFSYADWLGPFYPERAKAADFLKIYATHFDTVELDTTFYATPPVDRVKRWAASVPDSFRFCAKTPKTITHDVSLREAVAPMIDFLRVLQHFGPKLGVVLLQYPPSFTAESIDELGAFLKKLPRAFKIAVEFRHRSWNTSSVARWLADHEVCLASADYVGSPAQVVPTTDFLYIRFIGQHGRFTKMDQEQLDPTEALAWWKGEIVKNAGSLKQVWGVFNNEYTGYSVAACDRFKRMLGLAVGATPKALPDQTASLFDAP